MSDLPRRPITFPVRRVIQKKRRFMNVAHITQLGVAAKNRFYIKGRMQANFDKDASPKPSVLHWSRKVKNQLLNIIEKDERDWLMKFMQRVRRSLWTQRSFQEEMILKRIQDNVRITDLGDLESA